MSWQDFLLLIFLPAAFSVISLLTVPSLRKKKKRRYFIPVIMLNIGIIMHFIGIFLVGGLDGVGLSLVGIFVSIISIAIPVPIFLIEHFHSQNK